MKIRVAALTACCLALGMLSATAQNARQEAASGGMRLSLQAETKAIPMGRTVAMRVTVQRESHPVEGQEVWTYLEGRRWGAVGHTDSEGRVTLLVPLPTPGLAHLTVALPTISSPAPKIAFPIGQPLASTQAHSNGVTVRVLPQKPTVTLDLAHRVGMAWEPWFTPLNARWDTAEAVSLLGSYPSENADVDRQQMLWMDAMGVDFLLIDWSNNIWGASHWSEHPPGVDQLVAATTRLMETLAQMRKEGLPTPQITLLLGLINGPPAKMTALNEELQYVYDSYIAPPRYKDLWVDYKGKPLITVLDTLGPDYLKKQPPLDAVEEGRFTIRWMSTRLEQNRHAQAGFWSWMDGVVHPIPTYVAGKAEALTVTPAFFGDGGWTYPAAMGRQGGATYLEEFRTALELHPTFLILNQWNEFAGQPKGDGFGPKKDQYVDTYNVPLSDDIEPTSLTEEGYRGGTGWGFTYQNLTRALLQIYRGEDKISTLLAVSNPEADAHVTGPLLKVEWTTLGQPTRGFSLFLDGKPVASHLKAGPYSLALTGIAPGRHTLTLQAEGAVTRFPLSPTQEDQAIKTSKPVVVNVPFFLEEK